jgi:hypothetical protein
MTASVKPSQAVLIFAAASLLICLCILNNPQSLCCAQSNSAATPTGVLTLSQLLFGSAQPASQLYLTLGRYNPTPGCLHAGIDFAAPRGTPVKLAKKGTVLFVDETSFGEVSVFDGENTIIYLHMTAIDRSLLGKEVPSGTVIGKVGSVGTAAPHLHLEVRRGSHQYAVHYTSIGLVSDLTLEPVSYLTGMRLDSLVEAKPELSISPGQASAGMIIQEQGRGFCPDCPAELHIRKPDGSKFPPRLIQTDYQGTFSISYLIPSGYPKGKLELWVEQKNPYGPVIIRSSVVTLQAENLPPMARIEVGSVLSGKASDGHVLNIVLPPTSQSVEVVALSLSTDPDGHIAAWTWHMDGAAICSTGRCPIRISRGTHELSLTVKDENGAEAKGSATIIVQ